jgi:anaerobic magnesium-protoporphyrin IX monomethyl ester cyclase
MLDVLIVNPGGRAGAYQGLATSLSAIEPPVWAGLMATFMRTRGYAVQVLDANALGLSPAEVAAQVRDANPVLAAIVVYGHHPSASTQVMPAAGDICAAIATDDPTRATILVGGHVAALPERTLREEMVTFVAGGEGLETLSALVDALRSVEPRFDRVPGLYFRDGDTIHHTAPAPLVMHLDDELPGVAWDLLPMERYRAHNWHTFGLDGGRSPYAAMYTTLGCPYHCTFCCIQAPFRDGETQLGMGHSYRRWSVETVLRDIDLLVTRYGVRHLKIADEMFVLNPTHVRQLCHALKARGYDLNLWAYARVDTVRDDMVDLMREAGIRWLVVGIESADASVRADVDKAYDQPLITRTLDRLRAGNIHVLGNYIFGLPEDDHASMQSTLDLAQQLNTPFANFYCAMAYPGSALYTLAHQEGWALPRTWSGYAQLGRETHPLATRHLGAADVLRFRDAAFHSYFSSPGYLSMIDSTFGPAVRADIEAMTQVPLTRALLA